MDNRPLKVLFLCVGNSCRSQMAEGWARQLKAGVIEPYSAGAVPAGLDNRAVRVMAEAGVDISGQKSKSIAQFANSAFDYIVTVCDEASENCPIFAGKGKTLHVGFNDPPALARGAKTEDEALAHYRHVRDEIRAFIEKLPDYLKGESK